MKIDFTIATKNSEATIEKSIDSIISNIPKNVLHHLVIVDNNSKDNTFGILQRYARRYKFIKLFREKGKLGEVRAKQVIACDTEWVAIIDSDVYINKLWWNKMSPKMNSDTGWILGSLDSFYSEPYNTFFHWFLKRFGCVAFTNTLLRRELMLEVSDELKYHHAAMEDVLVFQHIKSKGYKTFYLSKENLGMHEGDKDKLLKTKHMRAGNSYKMRYGFIPSFIRSFRGFFVNEGKLFIYIIEIRPPIITIFKLFKIQFIASLNFLRGVLKSQKINELTENKHNI